MPVSNERQVLFSSVHRMENQDSDSNPGLCSSKCQLFVNQPGNKISTQAEEVRDWPRDKDELLNSAKTELFSRSHILTLWLFKKLHTEMFTANGVFTTIKII